MMSKEYPSKIDRHEADEQINARREYITEFLKLERQSYRWVHLMDVQAIQLEHSENDPLMKNIYVSVERVLADGTTQSYREYHVDCHPSFINYISHCNQKLGGDLS